MTRPTPTGGPFLYQRIVVTGANGAGKTWFAQRLGQACGLPVVSNDALALSTRWAYRSRDEILASQRAVIDAPAWILEGGSSLARADVLARTEFVIWLDPPRHVRLWRIVKRTLRYMGRTRPEHPKGNVERPGRRQIRFAVTAWRRDRAVRDHLAHALADVPHVRLRDARAVRQFLAAL